MLDPYIAELQDIDLQDQKSLKRFQDRLLRRGFQYGDILKFIRTHHSDYES